MVLEFKVLLLKGTRNCFNFKEVFDNNSVSVVSDFSSSEIKSWLNIALVMVMLFVCDSVSITVFWWL